MNLIGYRKWFYLVSLLVIIPGSISLAVWKLKPSIDFTGGTVIELSGTTDQNAINVAAEKDKIDKPIISKNQGNLVVRTKSVGESEVASFKADLAKIENAKVVRLETVGPSISKDITRNAVILVLLASLVIVFYVAYSFRKVPKPATSWEFGIAAISDLIYDVLVVTGVFSILGHFYNIEVDPLFITAVLTVAGFSVHDTIVIFDRIRENLIKGQSETFEQTVNRSLVEMLPRTISTSFLVWIILLVLLIFGGETIRYFVLALVVGVFSGSCSSIINSASLLVTWQGFKMKKKARK